MDAKQRVEAELKALSIKGLKLEKFKNSPDYKKLRIAQQALLDKQFEVMAEYVAILGVRLDIW